MDISHPQLHSSIYNTILIAATNIVQLPVAFVRSGWVNVSAGYMDSSDWDLGDYWSRTAGSATNAYYLNFYPGIGSSSDVDPSTSSSRFSGFPLRCLYLGDN